MDDPREVHDRELDEWRARTEDWPVEDDPTIQHEPTIVETY
jgi:hypothetical protein